MKEIVNILGGTDEILKHYLSPENPPSLSKSQLDEINDIILSKHSDSFKLNRIINQIYSIDLSLQLLHLISDFAYNIPQNDLIIHLDASYYDFIDDVFNIKQWK